MSSQVPLCRKPYGCEDYDRGALSEEQQRKINQKKIELRIQNENYLREHPEVKVLVEDFMKQCFLNKPSDVRDFASIYFTDANLRERLEQEVQKRDEQFEFNRKVEKIRREKANSSSFFSSSNNF